MYFQGRIKNSTFFSKSKTLSKVSGRKIFFMVQEIPAPSDTRLDITKQSVNSVFKAHNKNLT